MINKESAIEVLTRRTQCILGGIIMIDMVWQTFEVADCLSFCRLNGISYPELTIDGKMPVVDKLKAIIGHWLWMNSYIQAEQDVGSIGLVLNEMAHLKQLSFTHDMKTARERCLAYPMNYSGVENGPGISGSPSGQ